MKMGNDLNKFGKDVQEYTDLKNSIDKEYQNLKDQIEILNSMWTGDAHDALMTEFKQDDEQVKEMLSYLKKVEKNLNRALDAYRNCENSVGETIHSL